ncbi:CPXCG motif-containing cysteine-rich protein [Glaciecola petra]|uniref:CPXCG motif-containing cysteine-rich protein n=1 Tax=Glaciecola petra TaxID=3075602 RepID=A0ABU2ZS45_9ALTE|nr:CPXCG motif-containing cysteine-rich protein [Aestuariibacter sp. P117]MDT0595076.1 CPXCG motif-containing cysteine-rich protein [Aestuariibacter sp. P117]
MSLSREEQFECPYCMTINDIEIDEDNDIGQQQIVDCQICCSPIEVLVADNGFGLEIIARRDDE